MVNKELVTIGIPFYNSELYLDYAIRSVINQKYTNWELILMDDGSKDNSLSIARKYDSDIRITVVSDGENRGLPVRLNELTKLAKGKYYARMDADDIMFPDRISEQVRILESDSKLDVIGGAAISIDDKNEIIGIRQVTTKSNFIKQEVVEHGCFVHPTVMGKTSWFQNNKYNIAYRRSQDLELWVRTVDSSNFMRFEEPFIFYREVGVPTLKKYFLSIIAVNAIYKAYATKKSLIYYCKQIVKLVTYALFTMFGGSDVLIKRRSARLDNTKNFEEILNKSIQ